MRFIGCKTLLLDKIEEVIDENIKDAKSFCDIFSGTSTVARYFKNRYEVYSNDLLYFSYVLQKATIENDELPKFNGLKQIGINDPINYFNELKNKDMEELKQENRFLQNTYAPTGNRMYFTDENALRIDFARTKTEEWLKHDLITENEYYYLIACIIEGVPFISNISGTYGAYHKQWDKRTQKIYQLYRLDVVSNNKNNKCYNQDGVELLKNIRGDILYIDPPYNERQYLPNYHVLETVAKYDCPKVKGVTGQREYDGEKSDFCIKKSVVSAFDNLIKNANFKYILISYSTDGLMKVEDIESILKQYGKAETYKLYKIVDNNKEEVKLKEEEIGKYNVENKEDEIRTVKGRIYINNLPKGNYELISNDNKKASFEITDTGKLVGKIKENINESKPVIVSAIAELIITIQTGTTYINYILIIIILLSIIASLYLVQKKTNKKYLS